MQLANWLHQARGGSLSSLDRQVTLATMGMVSGLVPGESAPPAEATRFPVAVPTPERAPLWVTVTLLAADRQHPRRLAPLGRRH